MPNPAKPFGLKPSHELPNVSKLLTDTVPEAGWVITFWRVRKDPTRRVLDAVSHRCPLFDERLGTSPERTLAVDHLHTIYYGPAAVWLSAVLWRLINANVYCIRGDLATRRLVTVRRLTAELDTWSTANQIPAHRRFGDFTLGMLGDDQGLGDREEMHRGGTMKLKAGQIGFLLRFGAFYKLLDVDWCGWICLYGYGRPSGGEASGVS